MKIDTYITKPCKDEDDGIYDAPYSFDDLNAALAHCEEEIDVRQQAIRDADTGEVYVVCGFDEDDIPTEDYFLDDLNEGAYDPYIELEGIEYFYD